MADLKNPHPSPEEIEEEYLAFERANHERQRVVQEILSELDEPDSPSTAGEPPA
jgi:hypothetical protein